MKMTSSRRINSGVSDKETQKEKMVKRDIEKVKEMFEHLLNVYFSNREMLLLERADYDLKGDLEKLRKECGDYKKKHIKLLKRLENKAIELKLRKEQLGV